MKKQEINYEAWKTQFDKLLHQDRHAARSWKQLCELGLNTDQVSSLLWFACDFDGSPGYESLSLFRGTLEARAKEAQRLVRRLREDKQAILTFCGTDAQHDLVARLEALTNELKSSEREIRGFISKRTLNPAIFRVWLITVVKEKAKRPYYRELPFCWISRMPLTVKSHQQWARMHSGRHINVMLRIPLMQSSSALKQ